MDDTEETLQYLLDDYQNLRALPDGTIIGTLELITTRALLVGLDRHSWEHRYCYQDRSLADKACAAMQSGDDEPMLGYVSSRHARQPKFTPKYREVK